MPKMAQVNTNNNKCRMMEVLGQTKVLQGQTQQRKYQKGHLTLIKNIAKIIKGTNYQF